jgi:membrane-associated protein
MEVIKDFIDFVLHLDVRLPQLVSDIGIWTYLIMFALIFCETGLVVIPFLPGDSVIFVIGVLSHDGKLNLFAMMVVLAAAAVIGDTVNYHIGKAFGHKLFKNPDAKFFKKKYLDKTHDFYERHGGKTIIIARFIPIIRTFAPFVAGMGSMSYVRFISFNVIGGVSWVILFLFAGFFFGSISFVKNNFTFVIFAIIFISLLPGVITYLNSRRTVKLNKN